MIFVLIIGTCKAAPSPFLTTDIRKVVSKECDRYMKMKISTRSPTKNLTKFFIDIEVAGTQANF